MKETPWLRWLRQLVGEPHSVRTHSWMGMFGAKTQKPTELLSCSAWTSKLARKLDRSRLSEWDSAETVKKWVDKDGNTKCCGAAGLKATQAYPVGYGQAVFAEWKEGQDQAGHPLGLGSDDTNWQTWQKAVSDANLDWGPADLQAVADFMGVPTDFPM